MSLPAVRPRPLIAVADVEKSSAWYQRVLGADSGHGGAERPDGYLVVLSERPGSAGAA